MDWRNNTRYIIWCNVWMGILMNTHEEALQKILELQDTIIKERTELLKFMEENIKQYDEIKTLKKANEELAKYKWKYEGLCK